MKPTPNYEKLSALVASRGTIEAEIKRAEQIGIDAASEEASLLSAPDALENDSTVATLSRVRTKSSMAPARIERLRSQLAALDVAIGEQSDLVVREGWNQIESLEASWYERFCTALAPFFEPKFFLKDPHSPFTPLRSKLLFNDSIPKREITSLMNSLQGAHPQWVFDPVAKATCILREMPKIPELDQSEPSAPGLAARIAKAAAMLIAG